MTTRTHSVGAFMINRESVIADLRSSPGLGIVAVRALPSPMVGRPRVARLAIGLTLVAKAGRLPGAGIVAG